MKKLLLLFFSLVFSFGVAHAQTIIDEDFLDLIEKNASGLWAQPAPAFTNNSIPDKYSKESAVILGFKRELTIDKKSKFGFLTRGERSLVFYENIRFKIKLNDKNAVNAFSEFYFRYSDKEDGFSAKIYKNNGVVTNVQLADAVKVENTSSVPEFFKSFFDQELNAQNRYYKVAMPDLEPGDMLEYVTITKSKLDVRGNGIIQFSPQYELCSKKYPVLFNQIAVETDDKSYFKAMSKNGAPEFKKETAGNSDFFRYGFTDTDRPTQKDVNYVNAYRQQPFTKFQVIYSNREDVKGVLMGSKGEIKSGFTKETLAKKAWEDYAQTGDYYYSAGVTIQGLVSSLWSELKKLGAKDWTDKEYIKNVYYRLRHMVMYRDNYFSDQVAAYLFGSLLNQKDIKSDLIISVSNNIGELKDVLFDNEIRYVTRVGKDYYFNFTDYSNPGELVESLLASEAYLIQEPDRKGNQVIQPIILPDATADQNSGVFELTVNLNPDLSTLAVSRTSTYKGISKNRSISDALKYIPYMLTDYKNYDGEDPQDKMKAKEEEQYSNMVRTLKERFAEEKPKFVKQELQDEFSKKVTYKGFTIASDGRNLKNQDLKYTENFELQGMVRKAGKKLLVNIPGLVGGQLQVKKDERTRSTDIDVSYARSNTWKINFKIPDGYTLEGLNELATNVDNEIGSYKCSATQSNGVATIEIRKVYKQATFSKEKWNDMLAFIDAAYNISFRNLLLKPNK